MAGPSNILKPAKLGLKIGDRKTFEVVGPHNVGGPEKLYSIPVKYDAGVEGDFPMNKTRLAIFVAALGDDSDLWVGAVFEGIVIPQNNPSTKAQVLGWAVDRDSIHKPEPIPATPTPAVTGKRR